MAHLGSDTSAQLLIEKLPKHKIHGQTPLVTLGNKQNLMHFEPKKAITSSTSEPLTTSIQSSSTVGVNNNMTNPMAFATPPMFPPMPPASMMMPPRMPPMMPTPEIKSAMTAAPVGMPAGMPPFFPPGMPPMPPFPGMMPPFLPPTNMGLGSPQEEKRPETPPLTESEVEEIMSRNRQVSTTAIARALADASKGDYEDASQTLRLAIKLIKQSKVSDDSRCQVLVSSLEQCLKGITQKYSAEGGSSKSHSSSSSRRKRSSRDGSSERSRDRYERGSDYHKRSRSRDRSSRQDERYERSGRESKREYRR